MAWPGSFTQRLEKDEMLFNFHQREKKCTRASLRFSSLAVLHWSFLAAVGRAEFGGPVGPTTVWSELISFALVSRFSSFFSSVIYCVFPWKSIVPHPGEVWGNHWVFSSIYAAACILSSFGVWAMMQKRTTSIWMQFLNHSIRSFKRKLMGDRVCQSHCVAVTCVICAAYCLLMPYKHWGDRVTQPAGTGTAARWSLWVPTVQRVSSRGNPRVQAVCVCVAQWGTAAGTSRVPCSTLWARAAAHLRRAWLNVLWQGWLPPAPLQ